VAIPSPVKSVHSRKNWGRDASRRERQLRPCTEEEQERVEQWIPLAMKLSQPYLRREPDEDANPLREDARSVAYYALVLAAQDFIPELGNKFVTYAYEVISKRLMIAFNGECKARTRFRSADLKTSDNLPSDDSPAGERLEVRDEVRWLMNRLRPDERAYLYERYWEGKNFSEIAQSRGYSKQAIENRIGRILQRLRELSSHHA
jgi:RNA polymerase sigma factor (sigma-70 family)